MSETTENKPAYGFVRMRSQELTGSALAWAVCEMYQMPAAILDGSVHVEAAPGNWQPFDPEAMLRSLVAGHILTVDIPSELVSY